MCEQRRLKARHGVKIVGADSSNASLWQITLDLNHKLHGAVVNAAIVKPHVVHFPSDRYIVYCTGILAGSGCTLFLSSIQFCLSRLSSVSCPFKSYLTTSVVSK